MTCPYKYLVATLVVGMAAHAAFADDSSDSVYRSTTNAPTYSRPYLERTSLLTAEIIGGQNKMTANAGSSSGSNSGTSWAQGLDVGFIQKGISPVSLSADVAWMNKKFDQTEFNGTNVAASGDASTKISTIRAAVMGNLYVLPMLSVGVGPYASTFVGDYKNTASDGSTSNSSFDSGSLNRVDYGASAGARAELPFSPTVALTLDAKYFFGLANLIDKDKIAASTGISPDSLDISSHTRDAQVGAGLAIAL